MSESFSCGSSTMKSSHGQTPEEVRVIVFDPIACAAVAEAFTAEGIAAFADYRYRRIRLRDLLYEALEHDVEYVVFKSASDPMAETETTDTNTRELMINVFVKSNAEKKIMRVSDAIEMVQRRRCTR